MQWLNYHHLLYFWTVARSGSIAKACATLRLAQPTISGQLRQLEQSLGEKLFVKSGRGLVLTDVGQVVFNYADEIFGLGRELQQAIQGHKPRTSLQVGISDMVPKLIAYRILEPVLQMPSAPQLVCDEAPLDQLLAQLADHHLDVVLTDTPVAPLDRRRVFNHLLGSCGVSLFASPKLAARYRRGFPQSLSGAPILLPVPNSTLRHAIDHWLDAHHIQTHIVGEFKDSALIKTFGSAGAGLFFAPTAIEADVRATYRVGVIGRLDSVRENFYAVSVERRLKHPAVLALCEAARDNLFTV